MVSRRAALAGGAVAFGALGVGAGSRYRPGIDLQEPPVDAWPMVGYGPSGTAANADASLPASPGSAWSTRPLNGIYPTGLVADAERAERDGTTRECRSSRDHSCRTRTAAIKSGAIQLFTRSSSIGEE